MLRTVLSPRGILAGVLLVASVAAMVSLGIWQWQRSEPVGNVAAGVAELARVDAGGAGGLPAVQALVPGPRDVPVDAVGALVRASGHWLPERTLLVADRELPPEDSADPAAAPTGSWVLGALALDDSGSGVGPLVVPVVRGWVPVGAQPADWRPPTGKQVVVGWLEPSEPLDLPADLVQPAGRIALLATADLVNRWPEDLLAGFVVMAPTAAQQADAGSTVLTLLPRPPGELAPARNWRNVAYSVQWYVFAGFAVVLWWRILRDWRAAGHGAEPRDPSAPAHPSRTVESPL